jgi:hypothetical protein
MPNDLMGLEKAWLNNIISQIQVKKFYGKITIILEAGEVKRVIKEESLKPPTAG